MNLNEEDPRELALQLSGADEELKAQIRPVLAEMTNPALLDPQSVPAMAALLAQPWKHRDGWRYWGNAHWVLAHGKLWHYERKPKKYRRGKQKQCFYNSLMAAADHGLTYVEGYAIFGSLAVHHAWNEDRTGFVVDLTLPDYAAKTALYFGVAFDRTFAFRTCDARGGVTSILDNYHQDFPLLRNDDLLSLALRADPASKGRAAKCMTVAQVDSADAADSNARDVG